MSEEELIKRGTDAEFLLTNEMFRQTVQRLLDTNVHMFFNSDPQDEDVRSVAYHTSRSLTEIINTLQQEVQTKAQIIENKENDNE